MKALGVMSWTAVALERSDFDVPSAPFSGLGHRPFLDQGEALETAVMSTLVKCNCWQAMS